MRGKAPRHSARKQEGSFVSLMTTSPLITLFLEFDGPRSLSTLFATSFAHSFVNQMTTAGFSLDQSMSGLRS
jgi:hypothetical protein